MKYEFDRETALVALGEGRFTIDASDVYRNPTGMAFGGWGAAICAKAVEMHEECQSRLISQTTTFLTGVGPGEVLVTTNLMRSGASTQFWRIELSQNETLAITADVITSNRRQTKLNYQLEMPATKSPEESISLNEVTPIVSSWGGTYDQRIAKGHPFSVNETPESLIWIKESDGRSLDRVSLFSILDTPMPRTFFITEDFHPGSTVSMSCYIFASDDDIAEAGSDYLLLRVDGATTRNSATDSRVELWSRSGSLLATSNQIGFFR